MGLFDWIGRSVDELMKLGYPESVAKRISSGELPMDEASRLARAESMSDMVQTTHYGAPDINEFILPEDLRPSKHGSGVYSSRDREYGSRYVQNRENPAAYNLLSLGKIASQDDAIAIERAINQLPVDQRPKGYGPLWREIQKQLSDRGFTGMDFGKERVMFDPSNVRSVNAAFDPEYTGPNILGSRIAPTAGAGLLGAMALSPEDASAMESGMPVAMQAGGQSAMDAKPDLGRDTGTVLGLIDFLLPLVGEAFKPATMGDAELTDEQRRMRKYYGQ